MSPACGAATAAAIIVCTYVPAAALSQVRLRRSFSVFPCAQVPSAEGETAYTKSGPVFLKDADGGRKVLQLRYPGDAETAAAREAMEAERKSKRPLPGTYSMGVQVGGGYRPRTAEDFSMRSISSLDGTNLLQATRKPAPDYLRKVSCAVLPRSDDKQKRKTCSDCPPCLLLCVLHRRMRFAAHLLRGS